MIMSNDNLTVGVKKLMSTLNRLEDELTFVLEDVQRMQDTIHYMGEEDAAAAYKQLDVVPQQLDVVPHVLESGPNRGKTALQWPSGAFVHNDPSLNYKSITDAYDFYHVAHNKRIA